MRGLVIFALLASLGSIGAGVAQDVAMPSVTVVSKAGYFSGNWTYRSFRDDANLRAAPNGLLFGIATIAIVEDASGKVSGTIGGSGWSLDISGTADYSGSQASIRFEGKGTVGGEPWVYDYFGYASPRWSNGVEQQDTITGTVVRTIPHSGGQAAAGVTVSFYAVRQP